MTAVIREKGGVEGVRRSKQHTPCKSILWLNRASTFIAMFIRGLSDGKEAKLASAEAYDTVLRPYHGFMAKKVVGNAMGLCPAREAILRKFRLPDEAVFARQMGHSSRGWNRSMPRCSHLSRQTSSTSRTRRERGRNEVQAKRGDADGDLSQPIQRKSIYSKVL